MKKLIALLAIALFCGCASVQGSIITAKSSDGKSWPICAEATEATYAEMLCVTDTALGASQTAALPSIKERLRAEHPNATIK
jgi:type IV pilus biogenesis protein CpaD/CtpE